MYLNKTLIASSIALVLASTSPIQAETQLPDDQLPIEAIPMIEKSQGGFFIGTPVINNLTVMIVRVFNDRGEPVLNIRSKGEPVELLATGLPDGEYRYQVKTIYQRDTPIHEGMESEGEAERLDAGWFTVESNKILQPVSKPVDEGLSFLDTLNEDTLALLGKSLGLLVSNAQAADVEASSALPRVKFNDTTSSINCCEWWLEGEGTSSAGQFNISDLIGSNNHDVIVLKGAAGVTNSENSMVVETNGDISWGNSRMFFNKTGSNLALGGSALFADFSIYDTTPDIRLHDETDTSEVEMELTDGIMYFKGRSADVNSWHSIMNFDTDAPASSFDILNNGDVRMGSGFRYHESGANSTLHIGGNTSVTQSLVLTSALPEIVLNNPGNSGVEMRMTNNIFSIGMDTNGDGSINTQGVLSINRTAPSYSLSIESNGNITFADSSMFLDKGTKSLAIGTTNTLGDFTVYGGTPDIWLHDTSTTADAIFELNNNTVIFKGRSVVQNPLNSIFTYHTDAPAGSLNIFNTGDVRMGTGFRYHESGASSTLHIGGNTTAAQSLVLTSASPELLLNNPGNSGAEMRMTNNSFEIGMDTDGDGSVNTSNIFSIDKAAPANSANYKANGDISWGSGGMNYRKTGLHDQLSLGIAAGGYAQLTLASGLPSIEMRSTLDSAGVFMQAEGGLESTLKFWTKTSGNSYSNVPLTLSLDAPVNSLVIGANGNLGAGTGMPTEAIDLLRVDTGARMKLTAITNTANEAPQMVWRRAHSNTGTPTAVQLNDNLGAFSFRGHDGAGWTGSRGFINVAATENWAPGANGTAMIFQTTPNGTASPAEVMRITNDGKVKINGVTLNVPDYVFEEDYELMTLDQLAAYIEENKHLPGVASAKEVNAEGLDLAGSQLSVLEKVEELTLYTLQQHEEMKRRAADTAQLKSAHRELLAAYHLQQQQLTAQQQSYQHLEQLVNQLVQSREGKSLYTSMK